MLRKAGEPTTPEEIRAAALQFVRKISGYRQPRKLDEEAFARAVDEVCDASGRLLKTMAQARGVTGPEITFPARPSHG